MSEVGRPARASRGHVPVLTRMTRFLARHAIALSPEQVNLGEGFRAAVATGIALAPALFYHRPLYAWIAFACFWTCLSDSGGTARERLRLLTMFALAGGVVSGLASWLSHFGAFPTFVVLACVGLCCGLARAWSPVMTQLCALIGCGALAGTGFPGDIHAALRITGLFIAGSGIAILFCLVVWRLYPYAPARRSIGAAYHAIELMVSEMAAGHLRETVHRQTVRNAIERARGLAMQMDAEHGNATMRSRMSAALATAERLFTALLAMEHIFETRPLTQEERVLLFTLVPACREAAGQVARVSSEPLALSLLSQGIRTSADHHHGAVAELTRICAEALSGLASTLEHTDSDETRFEQAARGISLSAATWRHACRLAVALCITQAVCMYWNADFAYWSLIASLLVVQPAGYTTLTRSIERVIGSIAGSVLAACVAFLAHDVAVLLCASAALALAAIAFRAVNYSLLVCFLTGLFVLVAEAVMPGDSIAFARATDNILGTVIGLVCVVVMFPERGGRDLEKLLRQAIACNLEYAVLVLEGDMDRAKTDSAQRATGVASINAEFAQGGLPLLGGLAGGGATGTRGARIRAILQALRRLSGEATLRRFDLENGLCQPEPQAARQVGREMGRFAEGDGATREAVENLLLEGKILDLVAGAGRLSSRHGGQLDSDQPEACQFPA